MLEQETVFGSRKLMGQQSRRENGLESTFSETLLVWLPEAIGCIVSILVFLRSSFKSPRPVFDNKEELITLLLAATIIILKVFDGREQTELMLGLTINSILQYLTSLTKVVLLGPILEALSQLKWLWFASQPRSLLDFHRYEEAIRGGIGIFSLLFRLRGLLRW